MGSPISSSFDFSSTRNQASRVPKRTQQSSFDFQSSFNQVSRTTERTTKAPRRTTRAPRRTTRRTTRAPATTKAPVTTRAPVTFRRPTATTPAAGRFEGFDKDNFIDDVFEVDVEGGERPSGWVLPPSLMAVAAVPGAPVINQVAPEARVPKDVREEEVVGRVMDPYLQFMPVPAVPDANKDTQA